MKRLVIKNKTMTYGELKKMVGRKLYRGITMENVKITRIPGGTFAIHVHTRTSFSRFILRLVNSLSNGWGLSINLILKIASTFSTIVRFYGIRLDTNYADANLDIKNCTFTVYND